MIEGSVKERGREGIFFCIIGPAGSGKTSLGEGIRAHFEDTLSISISTTSRPPRDGEIRGKDYEFVSRENFLSLISQEAFFEYEEVHGNLYGTKRATLEQARTEGQDLLMRIDIKGALRIKEAYPENTILIFITPPSFAELVVRIKKRSGGVSEKDLVRRLETARNEYKLFEENRALVDYLVLNDNYERALDEIVMIFKAERRKVSRLHFKLDVQG